MTIAFRSFACSGAGIRFALDSATGQPLAAPQGGGALLPYTGVAGESAGAAPFAPQVTQARSFLAGAGRRADAVVKSFGGNDFGFANIVFLCAVVEYLANAGSVASENDACQRNALTVGRRARRARPR